MADGRDEAPAFSFRKAFLWTEIFRCFQVALDPRKLAVAAAGILVMSFGWYVLSAIFWSAEPIKTAPEYSDDAVLRREFPKKPDDTEYTAEERRQKGLEKFEHDHAQWRVLDELAGPGGRLRTMPWYEYRGPNPYLFTTELAGSPSATWWGRIESYFLSEAPVLAEPLVKFLLPVVKIIDPNASPLTRLYLLLVMLWSVATWAFFGGVITRIAVIQLSGKDRISLRQAVQYVAARYLSYLISPLVPLGIIAVITVGLMVYGFIALIPILGDLLLYGLGMPLVILGGVVMTILLIGLVGYPMMYTTLSAEGSDTFDALSRSYNYVFQAPWHYIWYSLVAVVYGAAVTFFVIFVSSMMVYLGKWAITQTPLNEYTNQRPDYLFVYAPESFGWRELLLRGSPLELREQPHRRSVDRGPNLITIEYAHPDEAAKYRQSYQWWNRVGAGMVTFWLVILFLLMLGFSYSFFWSAMTMIYLLMRRKVDEVEMDEVYLEDEAAEAPITPPTDPTAPPTGPGVASLPMVPPPPAGPLPPPAAVSFTGPVAAAGTPAATVPPISSGPAPATIDGDKTQTEPEVRKDLDTR